MFKNVLYFNELGLIRSIDTDINGEIEKVGYIPMYHVDLIFKRLKDGYTWLNASLVYEITREEAAYIFSNYENFKLVGLY